MAPGIALKEFLDVSPKKMKKLKAAALEEAADGAAAEASDEETAAARKAAKKLKKKKKESAGEEAAEKEEEEPKPKEKKQKKRKQAEPADDEDAEEAVEEEPPKKKGKETRKTDDAYRAECVPGSRGPGRTEPSVFLDGKVGRPGARLLFCAANLLGGGPAPPHAVSPPHLRRHTIRCPPECTRVFQTFDETEFPLLLIAALKKQGFDAPTPIQVRSSAVSHLHLQAPPFRRAGA